METIQKILEEFRKPEFSTEHIAEATNYTTNMTSKIKPVFQDVKMVGTAITVKTPPGIMREPLNALTLAGPGDVIVIYEGGSEELAVWGGVISWHAQKKGVEGVVIDGATRDLIEIRQVRFPVFARAACHAIVGVGEEGMGQFKRARYISNFKY